MDCDGHPENVLTRDELLDNVMMYWVNRSAASSARLYWESADFLRTVARVDLPTGIASYPKEIFRFPYRWCEGELQHRPLVEDASGRTLRGVRTTRAVRRGSSGIL